jgi:putative oxidoreductase
MFEQLLSIQGDSIFNLLTLVLRLILGFVVLPHGAQKLLGWFGGYGFKGTMNYFTQTLRIPYVLGLLAILAESFGALALIGGLLTRPAALGIGVVLLTAAIMIHRPYGFFINWFGNQKGEGYEYFILAVGIAAVLVITGSGAWSLDHAFAQLVSRI